MVNEPVPLFVSFTTFAGDVDPINAVNLRLDGDNVTAGDDPVPVIFTT
jgi:hypothetical protein